MNPAQKAHIATVMQVATYGIDAAKHQHERLIRESWLRCVHEHRLEPTRMQEAIILPGTQLREHQDQMEAFLHIARHGLESLYAKVAGLGYVVLLTDARGVTVDFLGDLLFEPSLRKAGLYLGADWSEPVAGTCGVGTCISTGQALTVHLDDHFDASHIPLTCTSAPIYDSSGRLRAVLDVSQLSSSQPKASQHLALQLVSMYANDIESAAFLYRHRQDWILRLARAPQFLDVQPDYLIALDANGRVVGHSRKAQLELARHPGIALLGDRFDALFGIPFEQIGRFVQAQPSERRAVMHVAGAQVLFLSATPPPKPLAAAAGQRLEIPAPLASLSAGDAQLDRQIERAAKLVNAPITLLITGETGAGKEYLAKAIHASGQRRKQPFVAVNCAAIPENLIESELFGYLPGSFSGATSKGKRGLIAQAEGGTLFLDEIGDMPLVLQTRLLRVLSEREVMPIGATKAQPVNIRVIAATHAPLEDLVRAGRFRDDLYYRIKGGHLIVPPLRERDDLQPMIERMLNAVLGDGAQGRVGISHAAMQRLLQHDWPGNLRELRNVLDYAVSVNAVGTLIDLDDLPELMPRGLTRRLTARESTADFAAFALPMDSDGPGRQHQRSTPDVALLQALRATHWNVSEAARQLGVSRMTLYRRMKRAAIVAPNRLDA